MTAAIVAAAGSGLAALIVVAVLAFRLISATRSNGKLIRDLDLLSRDYHDTLGALDLAHRDIESLKVAVRDLEDMIDRMEEADLARDPAAVRARIADLLRKPE